MIWNARAFLRWPRRPLCCDCHLVDIKSITGCFLLACVMFKFHCNRFCRAVGCFWKCVSQCLYKCITYFLWVSQWTFGRYRYIFIHLFTPIRLISAIQKVWNLQCRKKELQNTWNKAGKCQISILNDWVWVSLIKTDTSFVQLKIQYIPILQKQ